MSINTSNPFEVVAVECRLSKWAINDLGDVLNPVAAKSIQQDYVTIFANGEAWSQTTPQNGRPIRMKLTGNP
jgi:hypothetical protein